MSYWILDQSSNLGEAALSGILLNPQGKLDACQFGLGKKLETTGDFTFKENEYSETGIFTDNLYIRIQGHEKILVLSSQACAILKKFSVSAEYFNLLFYSRNVDENYKIVSLLDCIDCIDQDHSKIIYQDLEHTQIDTIDNLTLKAEKIINKSPMFLLDKTSHPIVIVHEKLKQALENEKLLGFNFDRAQVF